MIAEWLYEVACSIGGSLNNSIGFERSPHNDAVSGTMFLWFMLVGVSLIAICLTVICAIQSRKEKKEMNSPMERAIEEVAKHKGDWSFFMECKNCEHYENGCCAKLGHWLERDMSHECKMYAKSIAIDEDKVMLDKTIGLMVHYCFSDETHREAGIGDNPFAFGKKEELK